MKIDYEQEIKLPSFVTLERGESDTSSYYVHRAEKDGASD
jgi:hypothetical protein